MDKTHLQDASWVFQRTFDKPFRTMFDSVEFENDTLVIADGISIRLIKDVIRVQSIKGPIIVDGYIVELASRNIEGDVDIIQIGDTGEGGTLHRHFYDAVRLAAKTYANLLIDRVMDDLATDQYAKQCIQDEKLVKEYYGEH